MHAVTPRLTSKMYRVPEDNHSIPLCIDIGVTLRSPQTYTITAVQKFPPKAEGIIMKAILNYNNFSQLTQQETH